MPPTSIRRRFHISVDIETTINATPQERPEHVPYYQAFVQRLLAHPKILDQLQRSTAADALKGAEKMVALEYGWDKRSDQQLLQPLIEQLEPAAQAYFIEEIEAGVSVYYFDGLEATVKQWSMAELDRDVLDQ
ncbi:MAG: hypothetical protein J2P36_29530 [Ktedonobacteraceae bacterium]|nr:hypothetical protein [Ktedonobacteraceae bacterium]